MEKNIVIIDNSSYCKGGTAQVAYQSAIELAKRNLNVTFISADDFANPDLIKSNVKVICIPTLSINKDSNKLRVMFNGIWNCKVYKELFNILKSFDNRNTIVHIHGYVHCFSVSIFSVLRKLGFKTVLTLHDYFIVCPCGGFYNHKKKVICKLKPMSLKCIMCNCDKRNYLQKIWRVVRQLLINYYVKKDNNLNLFYISNFSFNNIKPYLDNGRPTFFVKNPYDLGTEYIYNAEDNQDYVYMGRLSSEKGVHLFCEAFSQLKLENKINGRALIIGDGDQKENLMRKYPNIDFLGWKTHDDLPDILKTTRALIFPSIWYEGAPLTPIEFMSHGIPCISSDCCAAIEYINDKKNGLIFESENVEDLKDKLLYADNNKKWEKISSNLRDTFNRKDYSVESHVDTLIDFYDKI